MCATTLTVTKSANHCANDDNLSSSIQTIEKKYNDFESYHKYVGKINFMDIN